MTWNIVPSGAQVVPVVSRAFRRAHQENPPARRQLTIRGDYGASDVHWLATSAGMLLIPHSVLF